MGLTSQGGYELMDLWSGEKLGHYDPSSVYKARLEPASVVFIKATLAGLSEKVGSSNIPEDF